MLVEPVPPTRPNTFLKYKVEEQGYFILDKAGYIAIRDYIIGMENALKFAIEEIVESNRVQMEINNQIIDNTVK